MQTSHTYSYSRYSPSKWTPKTNPQVKHWHVWHCMLHLTGRYLNGRRNRCWSLKDPENSRCADCHCCHWSTARPNRLGSSHRIFYGGLWSSLIHPQIATSCVSNTKQVIDKGPSIWLFHVVPLYLVCEKNLRRRLGWWTTHFPKPVFQKSWILNHVEIFLPIRPIRVVYFHLAPVAVTKGDITQALK